MFILPRSRSLSSNVASNPCPPLLILLGPSETGDYKVANHISHGHCSVHLQPLDSESATMDQQQHVHGDDLSQNLYQNR